MLEQTPLFSPTLQSFPLRDGLLHYFPQWLSPTSAQRYFRHLEKFCAWQQSTIHIAGREVAIPRLNAWYGEPGAHYRYSGRDFQPLPWTNALRGLRAQLHQQLQSYQILASFNSALVNYYRDGNDSVAWHADNEAELGPNPIIASISLGASRRFLLKHRRSGDKVRLELAPGSLLLMMPPLQQYWVHCLPKTKVPVQARINVTFRRVKFVK